MSLMERVQTKINGLKGDGNYRVFSILKKSAEQFPSVKVSANEKSDGAALNMASLDYMGMSVDTRVIDAMVKTAREVGVGSGGSRNIGGTCQEHVDLEKELAIWHEKEAALIFSSGYVANHTAVSVLGSLPDTVVFSDSLNHASIIEGCRTARCQKEIFDHNNPEDLRARLQKCENVENKVVVVESLYSMDGDFGKVEEIFDIADEFSASKIVNEVHAIGTYGPAGAGLCSELGCVHRADLIIGSLSKGVGTQGGYIAGSLEIVDFIRSFGYGFIFTCSLPPAIMKAAVESIAALKERDLERRGLAEKSNLMRHLLTKASIPFLPGNSHIIPVMVGEPIPCQMISNRLLAERNILVPAIKYPTVPKNGSRLRVTVTARHTKEQIEAFVANLADIYKQEIGV